MYAWKRKANRLEASAVPRASEATSQSVEVMEATSQSVEDMEAVTLLDRVVLFIAAS